MVGVSEMKSHSVTMICGQRISYFRQIPEEGRQREIESVLTVGIMAPLMMHVLMVLTFYVRDG